MSLLDEYLNVTRTIVIELKQLLSTYKCIQHNKFFFVFDDITKFIVEMNSINNFNDFCFHGYGECSLELNDEEHFPPDLLDAYKKNQISLKHVASKYVNKYMNIVCCKQSKNIYLKAKIQLTQEENLSNFFLYSLDTVDDLLAYE